MHGQPHVQPSAEIKDCINIDNPPPTNLEIFVNHEYANDEHVHESCTQAPKMITSSSSARIFPSPHKLN